MRQILLTLITVSLFTQPLRAECDDCYTSDCYESCRNSACLAAAIGIGVLLFTGMVAVVVNDSNNSHSGH